MTAAATDLASRRWPELGVAELVLVPLGSTEQHGPHLPFDTDTRIAAAVAATAAARLRQEGRAVLVAPALPYGASGEHQDFPGTTSIGAEALAMVVVELARSLRNWASAVLYVNGHGGNTTALVAAVARLRAEGHRADWAACGVSGGDAHAGRTETSMLLHLAPELVHLDEARPGREDPIAELLPELRLHGVRAVSSNGVLGDPAGASAAEGAMLLRRMAAAVIAKVGRA